MLKTRPIPRLGISVQGLKRDRYEYAVGGNAETATAVIDSEETRSVITQWPSLRFYEQLRAQSRFLSTVTSGFRVVD